MTQKGYERYQAVELSFIKKKEVGRIIKQQVGLVKARILVRKSILLGDLQNSIISNLSK